ncbi:hypothetical protein OROGR_012253 [Orobanche gracilis]
MLTAYALCCLTPSSALLCSSLLLTPDALPQSQRRLSCSSVQCPDYKMKRYFSRINVSQPPEPPTSEPSVGQSSRINVSQSSSTPSMPKLIDLKELPSDPCERKKISDYHPNQRDEIRRTYLIRGPCQPRGHEFPYTMIGGKQRRFNTTWFDQYGGWLEYSVKADKIFCLCCYLFSDHVGRQGGGDAFVVEGFCSWNKMERLRIHVGDVSSSHNKAVKKCDDLMRQNQSIAVAIHKQSDIAKNEYRIRLNDSIDVCRYLLNGALPFRGHDESENSLHRGHFLEMIKYTQNQNESVRKVTLKNAPGNSQMVSPSIQKDICHCFAQEILKSILAEIGGDVFALLVDESSDVSKKEQMAVVLRYVDAARGMVKERFVGLVHVKETSSLSLKYAIDCLFAEFGLSLKQIRGQGYDGASNMRGEFNGLKALIMRENNSAHYVHCFAHQLQLVVVAIAKKHFAVGDFFDMIAVLINVVGGSCKRTDMIRDSQKERLLKEIGHGEIETGSGLNQELSLIRAGDTRWSSHYKTLMRLVDLYPTVMDVLDFVEKEGEKDLQQRQANGLQIYFTSFNFVFYLHLMLHIFGLTDSLSTTLQRKDQDILNAMSMVKSTKRQLQKFRLDGWDLLLKKIFSFCDKHGIEKLNMMEPYINPKNRRQKTGITYEHYYSFDCFNVVVDMQIAEFNDRFNEINSELLICMAALDPRDSFGAFDPLQLMRLAELYPDDFGSMERMTLEHELIIYIDNVKEDGRFSHLTGIGDLVRVMVQTKKHLSYPLVFRLLKLALVLPVATATVERCFSTMKLVKSDLRNRIGDEFLSDCLISAIEKETLANVTNEDVIIRFQKMKTRREQL